MAWSILRLKSTGIEWIDKLGQVITHVEYTPDVVSAQEVVNKEKLIDLVGKLIVNRSGVNVIVIASDETVFSKEIPVTNETNIQAEAERIWNEIPIDEQKLAKKMLVINNRMLVVAANKDIYDTVLYSIKELGGKAKGVVAEPVMKFLWGQSDVKTVLKRIKEIDRVAFNELVTIDSNNIKPRNNKRAILVACLVLLLISASGTLILVKRRPVPAQANEKVKIIPSVTPEPVFKKNDIKIQVLNGTDIPGLDEKLKNKLITKGYANIEVGNTEGGLEDKGDVQFLATVSGEMRSEVVSELEELLGQLVVNEDTSLIDFEARVIIRKDF